ncbi:alpha/beta fold hydrolase [Flavobacterium luminosum]|uniref:Alpha/beta hydrolase n=1 Tax=Flavobacterium luminosum TaxID=2949086 RepID=A0ABT0TL85_9FLAO|nr:alpha/beta hydrolase [Flavobacterium sp. HXWNR70]MCL9808222.1 alpha/beta hydrolase [Flavobacterium sp. HXWNR70]
MQIVYFKNTTIAYSDSGKGKTIVLLHGFLENRGMWNYHAAILAKKHRVVAIDLLGHGSSECLGYIHTMEDMADAVHAVLHHLKIKTAVFVGHSMGGYVSLAFAELYPDWVKGIVLLNSTAKEDSEERKINRLRAIKAVKQNYTTFISMAIANLFCEENRDRLRNEIDTVKEEALKTPLQGIIAALEGMRERVNREKLLHIATFPILLILGKKDPVLNYSETITQIEGTETQFVSFPDGHMSHIENRDDLSTVLLDFMDQT